MNTIPNILLYSTLARKKKQLLPIQHGKIGLYVCGMTVYDHCHLGHARVMAFFDSMVRYLRASGYQLRYIRNITDIDDKIFARAAEQARDFNDLTDEFINAMHQDFDALGFLPPDHEPRVTDYMPQIIDIIALLLKRGYAYITTNGDIYYRVHKFAAYGQLSGKNTSDLRTGVRIEPDSNKESPLDFALWKASKPGEPGWESPWSQGRPGWHIECSAMSISLLGTDFDIHGGGPDLVFPHHENEIAQSCGAYDCQYAHNWMHVAPLRLAGEKMSKSLGNFYTVRELLSKHRSEHIRFFLAGTHYRSPIQFDKELINQAANATDRLYQSIEFLPITTQTDASLCSDEQEQFHKAMRDDFNTPQALAALFALARRINSIKSSEPDQASAMASLLVQLARSIGLMQQNAEDYFTQKRSKDEFGEDRIEQMIADRNRAKQQRDFQKADQLRQQLLDQGIMIEDLSDGTRWKRK